MFNVLAGFTGMGVFKTSELNNCMSVEIECGGQKCLALIDTGCMANLVSKRLFERLQISEGKMIENVHGNITGIGNFSVPVLGGFIENVKIAACRMNESEFLVIDG